MKIRSLFYHIKDGLKNIYRNRLFSLASIATIAACIFLFGILYSLVMNFQYMVKKAENEVCVTVFFDEGLSETQIKQLGDTISKELKFLQYITHLLKRHGIILSQNILRSILNSQKDLRMIIRWRILPVIPSMWIRSSIRMRW